MRVPEDNRPASATGQVPKHDLLVVGGGAAGMMAAIQAAYTAPVLRILIIEGSRRPGAKILVSGGGRCNISNSQVRAGDFNGSKPEQIAAVLRALPVPATRELFGQMGLQTVEEGQGRLYPKSQRAADVLETLLDETHQLGIAWSTDTRVTAMHPQDAGFLVETSAGAMLSRRIILATGGRSLPRSGSDGNGYELARQVGLTPTAITVPALSPLLLSEGHPLRQLSGITCPVALSLHEDGRKPKRWSGDLLLTHFGISGPVVLDCSRHLLWRREEGAAAALTVDWLPEIPEEDLRSMLTAPSGNRRVMGLLQPLLPTRLAESLLSQAGLPPEQQLAQLSRPSRATLLGMLKACPLPVTGARSWHHAETTAGGVPLDQLGPGLEALSQPGLHLCGELCDVDGRLGGFNFQWAWSSGAVAGRAAACALSRE